MSDFKSEFLRELSWRGFIKDTMELHKFYLDRLCEFMQGRTEPVKWEQSWLIETVNEEEWDHGWPQGKHRCDGHRDSADARNFRGSERRD